MTAIWSRKDLSNFSTMVVRKIRTAMNNIRPFNRLPKALK